MSNITHIEEDLVSTDRWMSKKVYNTLYIMKYNSVMEQEKETYCVTSFYLYNPKHPNV